MMMMSYSVPAPPARNKFSVCPLLGGSGQGLCRSLALASMCVMRLACSHDECGESSIAINRHRATTHLSPPIA
jgi:hypothetical protein